MCSQGLVFAGIGDGDGLGAVVCVRRCWRSTFVLLALAFTGIRRSFLVFAGVGFGISIGIHVESCLPSTPLIFAEFFLVMKI